jgi:hypothetical protein
VVTYCRYAIGKRNHELKFLANGTPPIIEPCDEDLDFEMEWVTDYLDINIEGRAYDVAGWITAIGAPRTYRPQVSRQVS